ncbi:MAG: CCA tRNA nucleotidyltransferase [Alphaproteobacteria bacterium]|nr:MAG: CCA tRNA nucleotidyltransferase [Alphaproteobacteria bacterium]
MRSVANLTLKFHITDPRVERIICDLNTSPWQTKLVGGAVRDAIMGKHSYDLDCATTASPTDVIAILERHSLKPITVGIAFGTVGCVLASGYTIEITHLRKDTLSDGRYATARITDDWHTDAQRRDFTMNALYADLDGTVYDPLGRGFRDLQEGCVCFIGEPSARITEDYLRILRYYRFYAHFGRLHPRAVDQLAIATHREGLARISRERIKKELSGLFTGTYRLTAVGYLLTSGVWEQIFKAPAQYFDIERMKRADDLQHTRMIRDSPYNEELAFRFPYLFYFYALLKPEHHSSLESILRKALSFSKNESNYIQKLKACMQDFITHPVTVSSLDQGTINCFLYTHGKSVFIQALLLAWIDGSFISGADQASLVSAITTTNVPEFPVRGTDISALYPNIVGKNMGKALHMTERWWFARQCTASKKECLDFIKDIPLTTVT